ncbi:uncharacterized protein LOC111694964 isoform X2 [Eurytemora carolleeae]|nr:uncharacterized protein LOC111694964 isoform X2 [Eurytemora carolleeae]XP_023321715.1 uncharacterized protein LOC111694964 isoform X2 [Eurytemora carolleeae]XP_023322474.1 uncharacterized protein LOC111694964 isoform X2 [Eurytemora carolleeae]|eukprot:XP_023320980.1 uncharacterized protein LOC111694964 isoform X2 [Eurytemora affinis]
MAPHNQVRTMRTSAMESIFELVLQNFLKISVENSVKFGKSLYELIVLNPPGYEEFLLIIFEKLEQIFSKTPAQPVLRSKVRNILPCLLGPNLKTLNLSTISAAFDKKVTSEVYNIMDSVCNNLESLTLGQSFIFTPEIISNMNTKLEKFNKLVNLNLLYIASSDMLVNLGTSCPHLKQLNVKGSSKVCDLAVPHIIGCKNLMVLDIQGTQLTGEGRLELAEKCENIQTIDHCPYNCDTDFRIFKSRGEMFDLIKRAYNGEEPDIAVLQREARKGYRLKNFWLSNPKSDELGCSAMFPYLKILRLDFVFQDLGFTPDPSSLSQIKTLRTLDLNFYDNARNDLFRKIMESCGGRLTKLMYNVFAEYSSIVECHNIIATMCPNLEYLRFEGDYSTSTDEDLEPQYLDIPPESLGFLTQLKELSLGGHCTNKRLSWLLTSALKIEKINLDGNLEQLGNTAWSNLLADNPLKELESVWINTSSGMGLDSINLLIDNCPKLMMLGRLVNLTDVLAVETRNMFYRELVERVRNENLNLELVWVSPRRGFAACRLQQYPSS